MIPPYGYACLMKPDWGVSVNIKDITFKYIIGAVKGKKGDSWIYNVDKI